MQGATSLIESNRPQQIAPNPVSPDSCQLCTSRIEILIQFYEFKVLYRAVPPYIVPVSNSSPPLTVSQGSDFQTEYVPLSSLYLTI